MMRKKCDSLSGLYITTSYIFFTVHCSMRLQLVLCAILIKSHTQLVIRVSYLQTTLRMVGRRIIIFWFVLKYFVRLVEKRTHWHEWWCDPHRLPFHLLWMYWFESSILSFSFVIVRNACTKEKTWTFENTYRFYSCKIYTQIWNKTGSTLLLRFILCAIALIATTSCIARCDTSKLCFFFPLQTVIELNYWFLFELLFLFTILIVDKIKIDLFAILSIMIAMRSILWTFPLVDGLKMYCSGATYP